MVDLAPQLTETWAATYLQVLVGMFVFALGIPALIIQFDVQEDVRHVVHRTMRLWMWRSSLFLLGLSSITFVWVLHPVSEDKNRILNVEEYSTIGGNTVKGHDNSTNLGRADNAETEHIANTSARIDLSSNTISYISAALVSLIPGLSLLFGFSLLSGYKRKNVVLCLEKRLVRQWKKYKNINADDLNDLVYLGMLGKQGYEKKIVIESLNRVSFCIQQSTTYNGGKLEPIIKGFRDIITSSYHPLSEENMIEITESFKLIWERLSKLNHNNDCDLDQVFIIDVVTDIGKLAVTRYSDSLTLLILNSFPHCSANFTFEIGRAALKLNRYLIAMAALNKLEYVAEAGLSEKKELPYESDNIYLFIGLHAYFCSHGYSTRRRAREYYNNQAGDLSRIFFEYQDNAFEYFYHRGDCEASDIIKSTRVL